MEEDKLDSQSNGNEPAAKPVSKNKEIGAGTPLADQLETPLFVPEDKYEQVMHIGPGTPLKDPEDGLAAKTTSDLKPESIPPASPVPSPEKVDQTPAEASEPVNESGEGNFVQQLEQSWESEPAPGEIISGRVIRIDAEDVIIDIGAKSEGVVPKEEFLDARGQFNAQINDEIEVLLERRENQDGLLVLSKRKVDRRRGWQKVRNALINNSSIEGLIYEKCKGGYMVDLGSLQAFLPGSQLDMHPVSNPDAYLNQRFQFKVVKLNRERGNIVLSRRNHLIENRNKKRSEALAKLTPGRLVRGVVKNITNFGAFIDIGGIDALLHVNDMSWAKINHPRQMVKVGDEIEVLVLSVDESNGRISLGLKQKSQDPWQNILTKYPKDSIVEGEVVTLTDFGAFLRLEEGVEGLLPVSELSWTRRIRHPQEVLRIGDDVRVKVLAIDPAAKKITLGLRQTEPEPFTLYNEQHKVGDVVPGVVKSLTRFGAFIELAEGVNGLLHLKDLSWGGSMQEAEKLLQVGETIQVKILDIQSKEKKIALGLKQLQGDPWSLAVKKYPVGSVVKAKVIRQTKFGVFVQLEPGIEGLIHISQLAKEKGQNEPTTLPVGQMVEAKVVKVNGKEHKIGLSVRELVLDQEEAEMRKYISNENKPGISLSEVTGISREELLKRINSPTQE